ncbi:hypothetical protein GCM10008955_30640 [Deinococcus malanensis]|uniref:Uncharacterized protein n=1 Tax=Deinococcus malanensis TaxID=1706855 RepID=A0ABQ2F2X4_9DEIO|nr:hypothetical protein [Deinococcus malanensis]GGK34480.1 hypothetical protein GCM10008955_30640 [Deinococcus malanensis]
MRIEFDPTLNGGLDKLHRYHQEAVVHAAHRQAVEGQDAGTRAWWSTAVRQMRQLFRRPAVPATRH